MSKLAKALSASAGNAGGDKVYVEDVFSTFLYTGTGSARAIVNGIDLAGEGGLVWVKSRGAAASHILAREPNRTLNSDLTAAEDTYNGYVNGYNSNGFSVGDSSNVNQSNTNIASWTFRKAEKFFDVVNFTGDGTSNRDISHSLDATVGSIFLKRTNASEDWYVYHRNIDSDPASSTAYKLILNTTAARANNGSNGIIGVTTSTFKVHGTGNTNGATYVAYVFSAGESDAAVFGDDEDENIIKCGSFTTDGNYTPQDINLGFEPQWFMYKRADAVGNWYMADIMRVWTAQNTSGESAETYLYANLSSAEAAPNTWGSSPNATGINWRATGLTANSTYIYMAIRRPMKTPEAGTEVFGAVAGAAGDPNFLTSFPVDMGLWRTTAGDSWKLSSRLTGVGEFNTNATTAQITNNFAEFDYMNGWYSGNEYSPYMSWNFKRASGFMDVVCYSGTGSATSFNHNLGVIPLLQIIKRRNGATSWYVNDYALSPTSRGFLNAGNNFASSGTEWSGSNATTFSVYSGGLANINTSGATYINYLFATVAGVSKVGSYTGNAGYAVNVPCGFSGGARFILIKRTDSTGDWYVWDNLRGITAGNDPYLLLNETNAQVTNTDYVDPLSSGFTVTSSAPAGLNASGGRYLFLAIA